MSNMQTPYLIGRLTEDTFLVSGPSAMPYPAGTMVRYRPISARLSRAKVEAFDGAHHHVDIGRVRPVVVDAFDKHRNVSHRVQPGSPDAAVDSRLSGVKSMAEFEEALRTLPSGVWVEDEQWSTWSGPAFMRALADWSVAADVDAQEGMGVTLEEEGEEPAGAVEATSRRDLTAARRAAEDALPPVKRALLNLEDAVELGSEESAAAVRHLLDMVEAFRAADEALRREAYVLEALADFNQR